MSYMDEFNFWLNDDYFDQATKDELLAIRNNEGEIEERFYKELEFGTGGLRGVIGAGTNRMNIYTVRKASQGLANYIIKANGQKKGIAIAYDSRFMSPEFADEAALCMAANGIKAYVFESLRPTPELSFALRTLGCISGIVITASHNPPEYNGYKVYWEDGAQITALKDKQIITEVQAITDFAQVKTMSGEDAKAAGLYEVIGEEIDDKYMEALKKLVLRPESIKEQELPDGDFPTVSYPNPEDKNAFTLALKLAKEVDTDIATGETSVLSLPESNVLYFELEDGAWFCVRPSGTEPKIKYYAGVKGADAQDATEKLEALSKAVVEL